MSSKKTYPNFFKRKIMTLNQKKKKKKLLYVQNACDEVSLYLYYINSQS